MIGTTLTHFRITGKLGQGGMGEVYRAEDTRLGREVAVKVLPPAFTADPERLARFEREARVLASLSHPNIAAIHEVGHQAGTHFLVMELARGETLADRISRGPLPLDEALPIALQIAGALEAAHERGIVHRDLKPANVTVDAEGRVKLLDFGLARALEGDAGAAAAGDPSHSPTLTHHATVAGMLMGTAAYMSPEQARGKTVDRRSDIWAFGVLVWEMLAGRQLFEGETISDVLAAVLRVEIDPADLPADVPPAVRRLLRRCLARDPRQRLHDVADVRIVLADIQAGRADETAPPQVVARRRLGPLPVAVLVLLAAGLAFVAGWSLRRPVAPPPPVADEAVVRQMTFAPGLEAGPSFSPDGNALAYTTNEADSLDVAILPLAGGQVRAVAHTPADEAHPAWSPDGSRIAFTAGRGAAGRLGPILNLNELTPFVNGQGGDVFLTPAGGGAAVRLVEQASFPAWSPDGRQVAFTSDREGRWDIWRVPSEGGQPIPVTSDDEQDYQPSWSPDGRWIAFASHGGLRVARADDDAPPRRLVETTTSVLSPQWSADGRWVYFSWARTGLTMSLWRIAFDPAAAAAGPSSPRPQRISLGESSDVDLAVAADGGRLAWSKVQYAPDLWELGRESGRLRQITATSCSEDYPFLAADGRSLLFQSDCGGSAALWAVDLVDGQRQPVTPAGVSARNPRSSPDGRLLAYVGLEGERQRTLVVRSRTGLDPRELVRVDDASDAVLNGPQWSPDGRRIAFARAAAGAAHEIVVVDLEGQERVLVTSPPGTAALFPTFTGDGRSVVYQFEAPGVARQLWIVPVAGGEPRPLTSGDHEHSHPQGTPARPGEILLVVDHENIGVVSQRTGDLTLLTEFDDSTALLDYPSWSPDGSRIYFSITRKVGDLFMMETPRSAAAASSGTRRP